MSAAQSSIWQQQQSKQIASFTPKKPEIPSDGLCPPGDIQCEGNTPPPPAGTEGFCTYPEDSTIQLIAAIGLIAVVAILLAKAK